MTARPAAAMLLIFAVLAAAPLLVSDFWLFVLVEVLVYGLYAVSFNLLFGYGGMLAFGHAVFFGIGAYAVAMMTRQLGLAAWPALALAPFVAAAGGAVIAFFCIRLTGIYLGMLTFAFQMLVYTVTFKSYSLTGGDDGLSGLKPPGFVAAPVAYYYFTALLVILACFVLWRIVHSPFGLGLRALRGNAPRSAALGINVALHRWCAFLIAAFFAGLAGAVFALANGSVFPGWMGWTASATPIVMTILGGMHSFFGPLIGAAIYVLAQTVLTGMTEYWALFLGTVIILIVLMMPQGITGLLGRNRDG